MDGFFLTGRKADPAFTWKKLEGAEVVMFKGGQPLDMFKYACHKAGIDFAKIKAIGLGGAGEIDKAFRAGTGRSTSSSRARIRSNSQADGVGHVVAQVGKQIGPCGFSSLAATREWLEDRHGEGVHARLPEDPRLHERHAGRGDRARRRSRISRTPARRCSPTASRPTSGSAAGRRTWRSRRRRTRRRSTSTNTTGC